MLMLKFLMIVLTASKLVPLVLVVSVFSDHSTNLLVGSIWNTGDWRGNILQVAHQGTFCSTRSEDCLIRIQAPNAREWIEPHELLRRSGSIKNASGAIMPKAISRAFI